MPLRVNASPISKGLLIGLVVALVTAGVAASGVRPASPAMPPPTAPSATPAAAIAAAASPAPGLSPTASPTATMPSPTQAATPVTARPSPSPAPTRTPAADPGEEIGRSVLGRPIVAQRIGTGPIKVVLIGDIHGGFEANTHVLAQQLLAHFQAHAEEVPAASRVSLWIIPTMNPDGLAADQRWNANGVDLNRNADTDLDGCAGNDWSPDTVGLEGPHPGAGGPYPFSEPETRAIRDFMADAWIAVFYHSADEAIYRDNCQRHLPTTRLAAVLSEATGYPVPADGWTS